MLRVVYVNHDGQVDHGEHNEHEGKAYGEADDDPVSCSHAVILSQGKPSSGVRILIGNHNGWNKTLTGAPAKPKLLGKAAGRISSVSGVGRVLGVVMVGVQNQVRGLGGAESQRCLLVPPGTACIYPTDSHTQRPRGVEGVSRGYEITSSSHYSSSSHRPLFVTSSVSATHRPSLSSRADRRLLILA